MSNQTFKEKYIDLKYDWDLAFELSAEFICTIIFVLGIFTFPLYQWGSAITGFAVFMIASFVIYTFGRRCGALFNPAIATGLMFAGKLNIVKGLLYIIVEFLGALVAGGFWLIIVPSFPGVSWRGTPLVAKFGPASTNLAAIFMEMIACFILILVVMRVAAAVEEPMYEPDMSKEKFKAITAQKDLVWQKKMLAVPLSIGATLGFLGFATSYVSGAAYNPARVLGGCVCGHDCSKIWVYWIGEFVGGALAGVFDLFVFQNQAVKEQDIDQFYYGES